MKPYLFTLTISPVQSFISQARKSQDLFVGSQILSQLMGKVLETFTEEERIFPQNTNAISNKIVLKLVGKDPKTIGENLERQINKDFINAVFKATCQYHSSLNNFFQVYWVAVELGDKYQESYKNLERNLRTVKNLRTFSQESQTAGHQKCSLCGERNFAKEYDKEKLCLVCATKRCDLQNHSNDSFPSLADIVTLDRKEKLKGQDAEAFLDANPSEKKHYALLHFDVDSLGKTLSGLPEKGQIELSEKLGEFSIKAKKIVDKSGKTVYAGGDDFLGFVNLASLFEVIDELYCDFESMKMDLTFTASILIAHYKAPLHKVLDYSRELLEESKNHFDDKNGVGIMVMSSNAIISKTICRYEDIGLLQKMKEKEIAKHIHFKLPMIFNTLSEMSYDEMLMEKAMIAVEIKRLLKRENPNFEKDDELKELHKKLTIFLNKQTKELSANRYKLDFENFIGFLKTLEQFRGVMQ
ncbi:MAG TPA: hypothetical protein CFH84_06265 [Sulfurimonas sp. UBA12504]|nr:MAG TPA: hypothetical protein CFH84_06265 [Sulfurimonas sp. UBA12504]